MVTKNTLASMNVPGMDTIQQMINRGGWIFNTLFAILIVFFCFFYVSIIFNPMDQADNMKKYGGYIPGIRPGKKTAELAGQAAMAARIAAVSSVEPSPTAPKAGSITFTPTG